MTVIPWYQPEMGDEEKQLIFEVISSNFVNDGEYTTRLENEIAQRVNCKHVIAVTSGTAALYLSLKAFDIGPGDEVIVPSVTFIATANAVSMTGAKVLIADIDPNTLNICPEAVTQLISNRTKAVIPVHVSGRAANLPALQKICHDHNLVLIEDAAEAFLSKNHNAPLGTHGNTGILSFSPMKTITTGQGGAILTNDSSVHSRLRELKDQGRPVRGTGGADTHVSIGFNFKLTNIQGAMGLAQLNRVDARLDRMRRTYSIYRAQLSDIEGFQLVGFDLDSGEVPQWVDALCPKREELIAELKRNEMDCRRFWHPVHRQAPYRQSDDQFPKASAAADRAFWLPSAFTVSDEDIDKVCQVVKKFFKNHPQS